MESRRMSRAHAVANTINSPADAVMNALPHPVIMVSPDGKIADAKARGPLLEALTKALEAPQRPVIAIVGGAKVSTKLELLENLISKVEALVIGGAMANTFMYAQGVNVQKSLAEKDMAETARRILAKAGDANCAIILPVDAIVAFHFQANAPSHAYGFDALPAGGMVLDVGSQSIERIKGAIDDAATLVWNGPLGAFEVAPFGSVAPELFGQKLLWEDGPGEDQTAFELFAASLVDVAAQRRESSRFDLGLLHRIGKYGKVVGVRGGLSRIGLPDVQSPVPAQIDARVVQAAKELAAATPESRRVRVVGRLDLLGVSQKVLKLELDHQTVVAAVWSSDKDFTDLKEFLDRDVVIEGPAVFRPSGTLLRVDADAITLATSGDEFFRKVPEPIMGRDYAKLTRPRPGEPSGFARILGSIPAEESDEEFLKAIEELS